MWINPFCYKFGCVFLCCSWEDYTRLYLQKKKKHCQLFLITYCKGCFWTDWGLFLIYKTHARPDGALFYVTAAEYCKKNIYIKKVVVILIWLAVFECPKPKLNSNTLNKHWVNFNWFRKTFVAPQFALRLWLGSYFNIQSGNVCHDIVIV